MIWPRVLDQAGTWGCYEGPHPVYKSQDQSGRPNLVCRGQGPIQHVVLGQLIGSHLHADLMLDPVYKLIPCTGFSLWTNSTPHIWLAAQKVGKPLLYIKVRELKRQVRPTFFIVRVTDPWNTWPSELVDFPSCTFFKSKPEPFWKMFQLNARYWAQFSGKWVKFPL